MNDPVASGIIAGGHMHDTLVPAVAPRPQEQDEYYYDSDDSILDLDEEYPGVSRVHSGVAGCPTGHHPHADMAHT